MDRLERELAILKKLDDEVYKKVRLHVLTNDRIQKEFLTLGAENAYRQSQEGCETELYEFLDVSADLRLYIDQTFKPMSFWD